MFKINSVGVSNLRSLSDTGLVKLKPITLLVGRNSSGKSTFARLFPLLKQSSEASKRGPLLWWGRLVDFGSFADTVNRYSSNKEITIKLNIEFSPEDLRGASRRGLGRLSILRVISPGNIDVEIVLSAGQQGTFVSNIRIVIFDFSAEIKINEQGLCQELTSNTYKWTESSQVIYYAPQDKLLPNLAFFKASATESEKLQYWEAFDPFRSEVSKLLRNFLHGNTAEDRVRQIASRIPLGSRKDIFESLASIGNPASFRDQLMSSGANGYNFKRLCDVSFASQLDVIIERINVALESFSTEVVYLEPLRANAQRYYRQQSLAVGEIDSKGENIAMFLDNLNESQLKEFNGWASKHFGIEVAPRKEGGHISLKIKQINGGGEANIADLGFGFSQMLPIAVQLWAASTTNARAIPGRRISASSLIVIEQPELHLHPDYQAKLADVFVASVALEKGATQQAEARRISIIAETHSADLVNRLGALVAEGKISADDVQVILFEQQDSNSPSTLKTVSFDEEGVLLDWPTGFFTPSVYSQ